MKYDFTSIVDRTGKDALAVDLFPVMHPGCPKEGFDVIPMWVADMNFAAPPVVVESMRKRLDHPFFGYFTVRDELVDGVIRWQKIRNGTDVGKDDISFDNGVLGGVVSALNVYCSRGDNVLVPSPSYLGFSTILEDNGYHEISSPLKKDEKGVWRLDFDDMEKKIKEYKIHAAIFCSPHNPTGRVWEKWELEKFSELCEKYSVWVASDEIWSDLILPGNKHIPTQLATDYLKSHTVAVYAPTKTFGIAGIPESYRIIYDPYLKERVDKEAAMSHYNSMNLMSMYAHIGSCTDEAMEWLDQLCEVLGENARKMEEYLNSLDGVEVASTQGTYLNFADFNKYCERKGVTLEDLLQRGYEVGLGLQDGYRFHGNCHMRFNFALPPARIDEVLRRLDKYVFID